MTAPARADEPAWNGCGDDAGFDETGFDETDGAYAVAEPDPFAESGSPRRISHSRPSLRAELRAELPGPTRSATPPLPVADGLRAVLPDGLRRGSTVAVTGSVSLLLALLGEASASGAWIALVGMPALSAEAVLEAGVDLSRLVIISPPEDSWTSASWTTAVGALLDAVDVVVARPGSAAGMTGSDGAARRLTARARSKDAVLMLYGAHAVAWPAISVTLQARHDRWSGIGDGYGRITARRLLVSATGRGNSARPRSVELWLPSLAGRPAPDRAAGRPEQHLPGLPATG